MKFTLNFKCPDALDKAIETEAENLIGGSSHDEEADILYEEEVEKAKRICRKWFRWGEIVTLQVDTDEGTCTVLEQ